jgi:hypothetical protein
MVSAKDTQSLAGSWRFKIAGADAGLFASPLQETTQIRLPGTMDDAGLGPKNTKPPTLEGPYRLYDYAGPAWYQREIEIPADWSGKRVTLFLERCRWITTVWLDDKRIGTQESLIAPHVYDLGTDLKPGKYRLTLCVDNTVKFVLGSFVSALFGGTWGNMNGVIGRIELNATPPVWIDDVQVYPNVARKSALVKVRIGNATGNTGSGSLSVGTKIIEARWNVNGGQAKVEVPVEAKPWDEFAPNLTELTVKLGEHSRTVRFGMREFAAKGTQFTMNGRPVSLRGSVECSVFPLTGYPPTDVESWQRIFLTIKSYGLNHMRFHSWCPPEAAFMAADIEGIMLQPEPPVANVRAGQIPARDAFIEAEFRRLVDTYGNHPSFCLMALGNEYGGNTALIDGWLEMLRQRDPRHLYTSPASAYMSSKRQFSVTSRGRGVKLPDTDRDLSATVSRDSLPIVGHEIGQWVFWPDLREIKKWSGVMALKNFEMIRADMEKKRLLDRQDEFFQANGRLATLLYKEEIELLLRTPGYGGFALLDLHDYPTQGTALVGILDAFWDSKGFVTPEQFRRYCSPTVPLLRMPKRVYTSAETFNAHAELAHFGAADLTGAQPVWSIKDESGREIASGRLPSAPAPTGQLTGLGEIQASLAAAPAPCKLNVSVALPGTNIGNDWDIWVYPADVSPQPPANVTVCSQWSEAKAALAEGRKVLLFPKTGNPKETLRGRFRPVFWSPVWFASQKPNTMGLLCNPSHPLFERFPTESASNWQWFHIIERARLFIMDGAPQACRPLVEVIDNFSRNHRLGLIFEGRVGGGELLVSGCDLPSMKDDPAARQLLAGLYNYTGSTRFSPEVNLDPVWLERLLSLPPGTVAEKEPPSMSEPMEAKASASSSEYEWSPERAIDGDPETYWQSASAAMPVPGFPHFLQLELPQALKLAGIIILPQQGSGGRMKDLAVYGSNDGVNWGEPVAKETFANDVKLKTVKFPAPVTARYLKLVALSGYANIVMIAEFNVIPYPPAE